MIARIKRNHLETTNKRATDMASHSHKTPQVCFKLYPFFSVITYNLLAYLDPAINPVLFTSHIKTNQVHSHSTMGSTLQYNIGREASQPPKNTQILPKSISMLTLQYVMHLPSQDDDQDMADSSSPTNLKRGQLTIQQSTQPKKTRNDLQSEHQNYANQELSLGFQTMELLAIDNDIPTQDMHMSIREMIRRSYKENEATEAHIANISFPRIPQQKWPSTRQDGRSGHHFHLTQIPSDVEVNPQTGFALVYHILLNFAKPTTTYNSKEIIDMTKERFQKMEIELGELCESIAPLCNSKSDAWNGITRVHLKNPETDGNALLEGTRIFALELDEETTIAKIARGFDRVAANDELTLKITSKSMSSLPAHKLFESIIRESFKRNKEFEITQVLKNIEQEHVFVIAASPDQRSCILRSAVAVEGEIISPIPTKEKLTAAMIARKNCLVLIAKNLNKASNPEQVERELKTLIGEKNVVNVYFPRAKAGMHTGVANVEFLNAHVYKKFAKKSHKI
jgi:hypothetical protein